MVTFPLLTPSDFRWEAPTYEQVSHTAEDGAIVRQILMDTPGQGRVEVEFQNCRDSDFEAVLAAHDATYGQWDALTLPDAFWKGRGAALRAVIESYHPSLEWAFAEVPAADWAKKGRCTIKVTLKHRVRPLALTLAPGGTATPLVPKTDPGTPAVVDALPVLNCNIVVPPTPETTGCQAFWTSRLLEPIYNGSGSVSGNSIVDDAGNVYTCHAWMPVTSNGANSNPIYMILVKYDKDGAVLWTRKTDGYITYSGNGAAQMRPQMCFTNVGVAIAIRCDASVFWHVSSAGAQIFTRNYTQIAGTGQSWHVATQHLAYHAGNNSLYSFATQYSTMLAVRLDATTGAMVNAWDPYGSGYQATPGTPGFSPIQLPDGKLLMVGTRDSAGWIAVLNQDMSRHEEYVYNGSQPFIGIISYDASNWFVVGAYSTNPSTSYFYLISKSNYSIVAAYQAVTSFGVPSHVRGLAVGPNGTVYLAYRQNMFAIIDIPNMVVRARDYGNPSWRMPAGPSSSTSTGLHEFTIPKTAQTINVTSKMVVAFYSANYSASTYGPSDAHRVLTLALGTNIPPGTYVLDTDPPLNRTMTVTVTGTTTALTTRALPVGTPIPAPDAGRAVTSLTAGTFTPNFQPVSAGTFEYELQSASICPPKFWTSRLQQEMFENAGPESNIIVDDAGNSYACTGFMPPGAADNNAPFRILVTKRDKDGVLLWTRVTAEGVTSPGGNGTFAHAKVLVLMPDGVLVACRTADASGYMWRLGEDGSTVFHTSYGPPLSGAPPFNILFTHNATTNKLLTLSTTSNGTIRIALWDSGTGVFIRAVTGPGNGESASGPAVALPNGNWLIYGARAGVGWMREITDNLTVVQEKVYSGITSILGAGMWESNTVFVQCVKAAGANTRYYGVFSTTDLSVVSLKEVAAGESALEWRGFRTKDLVVYAPNRYQGTLEIDYIASVYKNRKYTINGSWNGISMERTTAGNTTNLRSSISPVANLGVAWWSASTAAALPDGQFDRHFNIGFSLDAAANTWKLEVHPPYTGRTMDLVVDTTTIPMIASVVPTLSDVTPVTWPIGPAPAAGPALLPMADSTAYTWDLQTYEFT